MKSTHSRAALGAVIIGLLLSGCSPDPLSQDTCHGKTTERCHEILRDECRRELVAFNEAARSERNTWRSENESKEGTTEWTEKYRALLDGINQDRAELIKSQREGKCSFLTEDEMQTIDAGE